MSRWWRPQATRGIVLTSLRYALLAGWLSAWAVGAFHSAHDARLVISDWDTLRFGGKALVGLAHSYRDRPIEIYEILPIQIGPPLLLLNGLAQYLFSPERGYGGDWALLLLIIASGLMTTWLLERRARRRLGDRRGVVLATVVALVILPVWGHGLGGWGHYEDAVALMCIVASGEAIDRRRHLAAAVLIGVAAAAKPWAIIFIPLLVAVHGRRERRAAFTVALAIPVLAWLPVLVADPENMQVMRWAWPVDGMSAIHALGVAAGSKPPDWIRPLQFGVAILLVALVSRRSWSSGLVVGMAARFMFDPYAWPYYGVGPVVAAATVDIDNGETSVPRWTLATFAVFYVPYLVDDLRGDVFRLVWSGFVVLASLRSAWHSRNDGAVVDDRMEI